MKDLTVLGASFAVVLLMVVIAFALGFRTRARIDSAELNRLLAAAEPGARITDAAFAADGSAALARLTDGKLLIAKTMADRVTLRFYAPAAVRLKFRPGRVSAAFADLGFPTLHMKLNDPPHWLTELAGGGGST